MLTVATQSICPGRGHKEDIQNQGGGWGVKAVSHIKYQYSLIPYLHEEDQKPESILKTFD